jgi:hypothetical protein
VCRLRVMAPSCGAHLSTVQLPSQWSSFRGEGQEQYYELKPGNGKAIESWSELIQLYMGSETHWGRRWIFRGEEDCSWSLETTLERAIRRQR